MKIAFLINNSTGLYCFRRELVEALMKTHTVLISVPQGRHVDYFRELGCEVEICDFLELRGKNPIHDLRLYRYYRSLLQRFKPDCVCTYTIKPNVYGGMACAALKIPVLANVTGLGDALENGGILSQLTRRLYRRGLKKARRVFFQNQSNCEFFLSHNLYRGAYELLPGSGVNLEQHCAEPYPALDQNSPTVFCVVGRITRDKGIREILAAAEQLKNENVIFRLIGRCPDEFREEVRAAEERGNVEFLGFQNDPHAWMKTSHAILHASYHEGMSNVLLEAAACGRPILASSVPGCMETFVEGQTGFGFPPKDADAIVATIRRFLALPYEEKERMGQMGRLHVEKNFDRRIIVDAYFREIEEIEKQTSV